MSEEAVEQEVQEIDEGSLYTFEEDTSTEAAPVDELEETVEEEVLPEKFQGKSATDIAKAYSELESELGRKGNEIGELRRLTDELLSLKIDKQQPKQEERKKVDFDSLVNDPDTVLNEAVGSNPEIQALKDQLHQMQVGEAKRAFETKHPDWMNVVQSPEFSDWVQASPVRHRMFMEANSNYDYTTGDELLNLYKETRSVKTQEGKAVREEKAKKAMKAGTAEKGSSGVVRKKVFRRADLIDLKIKNPAKYEAMLPEITAAYQDGRVK